MTRSIAALALLWLPLQPVLSQHYQLIQDYNASNFFEEFRFFNKADPTGGFVDYAPFEKAVSTGLASNNTDVVYLGVDSTNVYAPGGTGRPSVRLESKMTFTEGLFVIDLTHMPVGCGTWPAFWTTGLGDWPVDGEIDIIENVNDARTNNAALHATGNCSVLPSTAQTGTWKSTDCNNIHDDNQGCGSKFTEPYNYGSEFNANHGGIYAMEWTSNTINIWFFPPDSVPKILKYGIGVPDPATFGTPSASFSGPCSENFEDKFFNHSIIIDTTFCGGWGGGTFGNGASNCPLIEGSSPHDSCIEYVGKNPRAFKDAWWGIKSLRVWEKVPGYTTSDQTHSVKIPEAEATPDPISVNVSPLTGGVLNVGKGGALNKTIMKTTTKVAGPTLANSAPLIDNNLFVSGLRETMSTSFRVFVKPTPKPWPVDFFSVEKLSSASFESEPRPTTDDNLSLGTTPVKTPSTSVKVFVKPTPKPFPVEFFSVEEVLSTSIRDFKPTPKPFPPAHEPVQELSYTSSRNVKPTPKPWPIDFFSPEEELPSTRGKITKPSPKPFFLDIPGEVVETPTPPSLKVFVKPTPKPWLIDPLGILVEGSPSSSEKATKPKPKPWFETNPKPIGKHGYLEDDSIESSDTALWVPPAETISPSINTVDDEPAVALTFPETVKKAKIHVPAPNWYDWEKWGLPTPFANVESAEVKAASGDGNSPSTGFNPVIIEDYFPGRGPRAPGSLKPIDWARFDPVAKPAPVDLEPGRPETGGLVGPSNSAPNGNKGIVPPHINDPPPSSPLPALISDTDATLPGLGTLLSKLFPATTQPYPNSNTGTIPPHLQSSPSLPLGTSPPSSLWESLGDTLQDQLLALASALPNPAAPVVEPLLPIPAAAEPPVTPALEPTPVAPVVESLLPLPVTSEPPLTPALEKTDTSQAIGGLLGFLDEATKAKLVALLAPAVPEAGGGLMGRQETALEDTESTPRISDPNFLDVTDEPRLPLPSGPTFGIANPQGTPDLDDPTPTNVSNLLLTGSIAKEDTNQVVSTILGFLNEETVAHFISLLKMGIDDTEAVPATHEQDDATEDNPAVLKTPWSWEEFPFPTSSARDDGTTGAVAAAARKRALPPGFKIVGTEPIGTNSNGIRTIEINIDGSKMSAFKIGPRQITPLDNQEARSFVEQQLYTICPSLSVDINPTTELVTSIEDPAADTKASLAKFQSALKAYIVKLQTCSSNIETYSNKLKAVTQSTSPQFTPTLRARQDDLEKYLQHKGQSSLAKWQYGILSQEEREQLYKKVMEAEKAAAAQVETSVMSSKTGFQMTDSPEPESPKSDSPAPIPTSVTLPNEDGIRNATSPIPLDVSVEKLVALLKASQEMLVLKTQEINQIVKDLYYTIDSIAGGLQHATVTRRHSREFHGAARGSFADVKSKIGSSKSSIPPGILGKHGTLDPYGMWGPQVPEADDKVSDHAAHKELPDNSDEDNQWSYDDLDQKSEDNPSSELKSLPILDPFGQLGPQIPGTKHVTDADASGDNLPMFGGFALSYSPAKEGLEESSADKPSQALKNLPALDPFGQVNSKNSDAKDASDVFKEESPTTNGFAPSSINLSGESIDESSEDQPSEELADLPPLDPFGQLGPQVPDISDGKNISVTDIESTPSFDDLPEKSDSDASPEIVDLPPLDPFGQLGPQVPSAGSESRLHDPAPYVYTGASYDSDDEDVIDMIEDLASEHTGSVVFRESDDDDNDNISYFDDDDFGEAGLDLPFFSKHKKDTAREKVEQKDWSGIPMHADENAEVW